MIRRDRVLHKPSYPDIPRYVEHLSAAIFHSARWDYSIRLTGQRAGIMAAAPPGTQIVSGYRPVRSASCDQRSAQWIMLATGFSEEQKRRFAGRCAAYMTCRMNLYIEAVDRF